MTTDTGTDASRGRVAATAAEVYEEAFVPALFGQWAAPVLDAAGVGSGDRVLDVGCGTGVLTRAASSRVGPSGAAVGLDPNEAMLAVAARAPEPVRWERGRAEALPFPDGRFDRVVSQFVLMFVDDRGAAAAEIARVLRPGGTAAVATWCPAEESPGYDAVIELLDEVVGPEAADAMRAPFVLGRPRDLGEILSPVLDEVEVRRVEGTARFDSVEAWVHTDIRGWTLADALDDATYRRLLERARPVLARHTDADGRVRFPAPALIATGVRPH
jgi:ubiquinone/menaquinone biosynthesis C-methylase UbiE